MRVTDLAPTKYCDMPPNYKGDAADVRPMDEVGYETLKTRLTGRLKELGLTEYEASTLIALVRLGTATAKEVAETGDVPRSRVYDAVETLHERGLVDIQYTTPQQYTVLSRESIVEKLDLARESTIEAVADDLAELECIEPEREQFGTWTVTGSGAVTQRVLEFIQDAQREVVYLTVDDTFTDDHVDALQSAADRDVTVHVGGISTEAQERIRDAVPSATVFDTIRGWSKTPIGSLLFVDRRTALVSVRVDRTPDADSGSPDEIAIWGAGDRNSLVIVLRAIFSWQLEPVDAREGPGEAPP